MRIITESFKVYKFSEAGPELRDKIREDFASYSFLYDHCLQERVDTLKIYAAYIGGHLDYSISCVPDRGEFITIKDFNQVLFLESFKLVDCSLTGVYYDDDLIYHLNKFGCLDTALNCYLKDIHDEYESMLKDDYLSDLCEANDYEFKENGKMY